MQDRSQIDDGQEAGVTTALELGRLSGVAPETIRRIEQGLTHNRREIILFRLLRGSGMHWQESGFLDFVVSLEAALRGGVKDELAYRFSLYGALFLRDELEPAKTFKRLRRVYKVRSNLVHGTPVPRETRRSAEADAADLAKAVVRKAIVDGWPAKAELDEVALTSPRLDRGASP